MTLDDLGKLRDAYVLACKAGQHTRRTGHALVKGINQALRDGVAREDIAAMLPEPYTIIGGER